MPRLHRFKQPHHFGAGVQTFAGFNLLKRFRDADALALRKLRKLFAVSAQDFRRVHAVLGAALVNIEEGYSFVESVAFGFAAAIGFTMAICVFAGVRERLAFADPPKAFRGFPLLLISAGLAAMAFSGFSGMRF